MRECRKKIITLVLVGIVICGGIVNYADANGADERYADGIIVALSPAPLSPLVGEKVGMLFGFHDAKTLKYLTTIPGAKVVISAFIVKGYKAGDVIFQTPNIDSSSGSFNLEYVFAQEGTYDIHVIFNTPDGKDGNAGFLKQVRSGSVAPYSNARLGIMLAVVAIGSLLIGHYLGSHKRPVV